MNRLLVIVGITSIFIGLPLSAGAQSGPPVIEHIEPSAGPPGTVVHIVGRRFGAPTTVTVGGQTVVVEQALPNRLTVRIPQHAKSGRVVVEAVGGKATGPELRVTAPPPAPVIESVDPQTGPPGTRVRIRGKNFSPRLTGNFVRFGDRPAVIRSATPVELEVIVPTVQGDAPIAVHVPQAGEAQSQSAFHVSEPTAIKTFEPMSGAPGGELKIRGTGFSASSKDNRVYLNSVPLEVKAASPTQLLVELPLEVSSGKLLVDVDGGGRAYSERAVDVQRPPLLMEFEPKRAPPGTLVTLRGLNFGNQPALIDVRLGTMRAPVREAHGTSVTIEVPRRAKDGKFTITVNGIGPAVSDEVFGVAPGLGLTRFSPRQGPAGTLVTLQGQGFSEVPTQNRVMIGQRTAQVVSATATRLQIRIPAGPSGPLRVEVSGVSAAFEDPFVVQVPPEVTRIAPMRGAVGAEIELHGHGFGDNARVVRVALGGHTLHVKSARDDLVVARITRGAKTGTLKVTVPLQGSSESAEEFVVLPKLVVRAVQPREAMPGEQITIRGEGFQPAATTVEFGSVSGEPSQVESDQLTVVVPEGAAGGKLTVRLGDGRKASAPFRVVAPVPALPAEAPAAGAPKK